MLDAVLDRHRLCYMARIRRRARRSSTSDLRLLYVLYPRATVHQFGRQLYSLRGSQWFVYYLLALICARVYIWILYWSFAGQLQQRAASTREANTYLNMSIAGGPRTVTETPSTNRHKVTSSTQTNINGNEATTDGHLKVDAYDEKDELQLLTPNREEKDMETTCYLSELYAFLSLDSYEVRMMQHHDPTFL